MQSRITDSKELARLIRGDIVTMIHKSGDGHPGPSLSCTDILAVLYAGEMNVCAQKPDDPARDRLVLSKGHACPALYAALARCGYFNMDIYPTLRCLNSKLQGHPDMNKTPGVDMTSGSLGNGLPIAAGMALAARAQKVENYVYVITGDGELEEGVVWEGVNIAGKFKLNRLIAFVDNNDVQSGGHIAEIGNMINIAERFAAAGWFVQHIDGHDHEQILGAIKKAKENGSAPSAIIAHTTKGKGISYMENNNEWHKGTPTREQWLQALSELGLTEEDYL